MAKDDLPDMPDMEMDEFRLFDGRQSATAASVQRGVCRLLAQMGYASVTELTLATGRRVDILALGPRNEIAVIEIKSSLIDYRTDAKWEEYLDFCDRFYFAVPPEFPREVIPEEVGLVVADRYGAEILREGPVTPLPPARRKKLTLHAARVSARRVHRFLEPD
ncbi:MmcB family DNA repair protein [Parvibaculum sp.]|uniref:MmcB family DNA repair protein n=1 Tax=Parvibaculum sp. TaxID=2024848 RepID=UPI001B107416|nr:MmcB family DNA repair protein [Parvibaculum sp.]MBO6633768.1 MmcB family DNA repair protein [Parvibaculum sp.]MBO6677617.1 MmcB family DNA repair protein [Parvibaculum sp.]MBO6684323.1 MmcB family DNA repair protein [Parvibaculum sp.]MBO6905359.1 MmcB family DNA repair protein [Parvibaculum sp.]